MAEFQERIHHMRVIKENKTYKTRKAGKNNTHESLGRNSSNTI